MLSDTLHQLLEAYYKARSYKILMLVGAPGVGKSQHVYDFAEELGVNVVELISSRTAPYEVSGMTMPDAETKSMVVYGSEKLHSLKDGDILFIDEFYNVEQSDTLNAMLTLLTTRKLDDGTSLPDVMIVAASNDVSPSRFSPQIRNRFDHVHVSFDADEWCMYMFRKYDGVNCSKLSRFIRDNDSDRDRNLALNVVSARSCEADVRMVLDGADPHIVAFRMRSSQYEKLLRESIVKVDPMFVDAIKEISVVLPSSFMEVMESTGSITEFLTCINKIAEENDCVSEIISRIDATSLAERLESEIKEVHDA